MKRIYRITLLVVGCFLGLVSCRQKEEEPIEWRTELQVVSSDLVFSPFGGSGSAVLNLSGASVTSNASWCQASVSGETINVTVGEWGGLESRYAVLTASRNGENVDITVMQYGVNFAGVDLPSSLTVTGEAGTYSYPCSANASINVSSDADWISSSVANGSLDLTIPKNTEKSVRSATVTVTIGDIVRTVEVLQYPVFENTSDWVVTYSGNMKSGSTLYSTLTNTVKADLGMYTVTVSTPAAFAASGLSEADYVRDVLAPDLAASINAAVEYYKPKYTFSDFLLSGTDWDFVSLLEDGTYIGYAIGFDENGYPTGWYTADTIEVGSPTPYQMWLGEWSVPRGDGVDTWIVSENVKNESFKVSGIAGVGADENATGAFVAIVPFDPETDEMVFSVYESSVTWNDSSRGTMNALLSGLYKNAEDKTYYTSAVGTVVCRAKMAENGLTATLTPGTVTSAGKPATFYCIRWYGRYTNSSGSRSGASIGDATDLPNTMTKK